MTKKPLLIIIFQILFFFKETVYADPAILTTKLDATTHETAKLILQYGVASSIKSALKETPTDLIINYKFFMKELNFLLRTDINIIHYPFLKVPIEIVSSELDNPILIKNMFYKKLESLLTKSSKSSDLNVYLNNQIDFQKTMLIDKIMGIVIKNLEKDYKDQSLDELIEQICRELNYDNDKSLVIPLHYMLTLNFLKSNEITEEQLFKYLGENKLIEIEEMIQIWSFKKLLLPHTVEFLIKTYNYLISQLIQVT